MIPLGPGFIVPPIVEKYLKQGGTVTPLTGKVDKELEEMIYQLLDAGIF